MVSVQLELSLKVTLMQTPGRNVINWVPLLAFVFAGLFIGVSVGYLMWNPGAANYAVVSTAKEATRTVRVNDISVTFPSVSIARAGGDASIAIELTNLSRNPVYVAVSLTLVRNSGIDAVTISTLTISPDTATLASYGTSSDFLNIKPSTTGYAFFDLMVNGELAGSIALYVVPA
jgi:hypothetical protein